MKVRSVITLPVVSSFSISLAGTSHCASRARAASSSVCAPEATPVTVLVFIDSEFFLASRYSCSVVTRSGL